MKVLKDNYKTTYAEETDNKLVCEHCTSELEYNNSDIVIGTYGCAFVPCPCCGYENYIEDGEHDLVLTAHNVEFPMHFGHTAKENGALDCCNNETIKEYIRNGINYFRKNKGEFVWYCGTGNLYVTVYRYEGDENYYVQVTNNYYDTYIQFEEEDYPIEFEEEDY